MTERQFGDVSRTCTDARYLRAQLHGDAQTGCGAALARKCTETTPKTKTLSAKSKYGSHATTPNIPVILRCNAGDSFCRHGSTSSGPARICTDWHSLEPSLHGVAQTGCGAPLARSCTDLHGSADARTCTKKCNRTFQFTDLHGCVQLPFSIHGFAHDCTEAS